MGMRNEELGVRSEVWSSADEWVWSHKEMLPEVQCSL